MDFLFSFEFSPFEHQTYGKWTGMGGTGQGSGHVLWKDSQDSLLVEVVIWGYGRKNTDMGSSWTKPYFHSTFKPFFVLYALST